METKEKSKLEQVFELFYDTYTGSDIKMAQLNAASQRGQYVIKPNN
jgi:hypothetical protein